MQKKFKEDVFNYDKYFESKFKNVSEDRVKEIYNKLDMKVKNIQQGKKKL